MSAKCTQKSFLYSLKGKQRHSTEQHNDFPNRCFICSMKTLMKYDLITKDISETLFCCPKPETTIWSVILSKNSKNFYVGSGYKIFTKASFLYEHRKMAHVSRRKYTAAKQGLKTKQSCGKIVSITFCLPFG